MKNTYRIYIRGNNIYRYQESVEGVGPMESCLSASKIRDALQRTTIERLVVYAIVIEDEAFTDFDESSGEVSSQ